MTIYPTPYLTNVAPSVTHYPYVIPPIDDLVNQLGQHTRIGSEGIVRFNEPLIQQLIRYRETAVPALGRFLARIVPAGFQPIFPIIEVLYAAERLAEVGVKEVSDLYPLISRLNTHPHPLVQIYLAGFYREINRPETFGPLLSTMIQQSVKHYEQPYPVWNPTEEVGGTLLRQIARYTADETVKRLLPYLQTYATRLPFPEGHS